MLLSRELLSHQLRELRAREWCKGHASHLSTHNCWPSPLQGSRNVGGKDSSSSAHFSTTQRPKHCSTSLISHASTTFVVPMFQVWMRLNSVVPQSKSNNLLRTMRRLQLEQKPLLQNLSQAMSMRWRRFCGSTLIETEELSAQTEDRRKRSLAVAKQSWNIVSLVFIWLSQNLEIALSPASSGLSSVTESAAMEIINLSYICQKLNSVAIEYILNNDE